MHESQMLQPPGYAVSEAEDELGPDADWPDVHARAWAIVEREEPATA